MLKRVLLLSVLLLTLFSLFLLPAQAASSGSCGDNVTWSVSDDGVLTISGTGAMSDRVSPWSSHKASIVKIVIAEGITRIGSYAFGYMPELAAVELPSTLRSIGEHAFRGARKLSAITFPEGLTEFGQFAFSECESLKSVQLPQSVTKLPNHIFSMCYSLQEVILPEGLTSIGSNAFASCRSLKAISLPDTLTELGPGVFGGCTGFTSFEFPQSLSKVPDNTFSNCTELKQVVLPSNLTAIGKSAFQNCSSLQSITLPQNLQSIGDFAFQRSGLLSIDLPDSVTEVGSYVFANCTELLSATLGSGISKVSASMFRYCICLTGVHFRGTVTYIDYYAFYDCHSLASVFLPDGLETIRYYAFSYCYDLKDIRLPDTLSWLGANTFVGSTSLEHIYYTGTQDQWAGIDDHGNKDIEGLVQFDAGAQHVHNRVTVPAKPATCTEEGYTKSVSCGICAEVFEASQPISAGHSYISQTVSPTPNAPGYSEHLCAVCGHHQRDSETAWTEGCLTPAVTNNRDAQDYPVHSSPIQSYLTELKDGSLLRVEYIYDRETVVVETYDQSYTLRSQRSLSLELPIFGGFYASGENYYLVFGQSNPTENNRTEVIRIVKYSLAWERMGYASVYDANTEWPFAAGTLRMAHAGDMLYIRTSHRMYMSDDGKNHQANMMILLRMSDMTVTETRHTISGTSTGYVSHSFDQYILVDEGKVVAADHGDAYPRAAILFRYGKAAGEEALGNVQKVGTLGYQGETGENTTGASLGGFEASSTHYLLAGNSVDQYGGSDIYYGQRNIFLTATSKEPFTRDATTINWLTEYSDEDAVDLSVPHLVRIDPERLLVLWTEGGTLKYALAGSDSVLISQVYSAPAMLSDCKPIVVNGKVIWYVTENSVPVFYSIDPDAPEKVTSTDPCQEGHLYTTQIIWEPSFWVSGLIRCTCSRCGKTTQVEPPALTEDDYVLEEQNATCTEDGYLRYTWKETQYGEIAFSHMYPSTGHIWDEGTVTLEPTEEAEGIYTQTCTTCGQLLEAAIPKLEHIHDHIETVITPTCEEQGYSTHTCRCGDSFADNYVDALGHIYSLWLIDTEPAGGIGTGAMHRDCATCGDREDSTYNFLLTDVPNGKYYSKPVYWAYVNGITKGKTATEFQKDAECTRKQIVMFLWRAAGQPEPESMECTFDDVKNDSFRKAILWAVEKGITNGTSATKFSPDAPCTRKQIVMFLWRYFGKPELTAEQQKHEFTDMPGGQFRTAILWAFHNGITTGKTQTTFDPNGTCTRGQIVTFLYRAMVES